MGIAEAQAKWERNTSGKGGKWKANATAGSSNYAAGVAKFLGAQPSSAVVERQRAGVAAVSPEAFNASIAGKGQKWAENYRRGMTGQ